MKQLSVSPSGETALSAGETQQANNGSLATALPGVQPVRARRHAQWQRISLATDAVSLACALLLDQLTSAAMPAGWAVVFATLVIGLLATKAMYRPPIDLWKLDAIRSILGAVTIAAALTVALRAMFTEASAVADETLEAWLLATAFVVAGRVWLISSERRARKKR